MTIEVRVPQLPESVADATLVAWRKRPGEAVARDENLVDLETDKVVLEVPAPVAGVLKEIKLVDGATVTSGQILALIEESATAAAVTPTATTPTTVATATAAKAAVPAAVAAKRVAEENKVDPQTVVGSGRGARQEQRVPMTRLRARIAERMVRAQATQALLTSFNEVDLHAVNELRARYKEPFERQYGHKLGYMPFFAKACIEALKKFPSVNASVDGSDIVYHEYFDLGIAVSTDRGLIVPVLRGADQLSFAEIEKSVANYASRARAGTITIEELTGGTFTITNGGVFGSLLSTPIVNAPQSAILGMHKIQDRAVVIAGQVVVRPMMYVALTYDHRLIDGREAVQFLVWVKQCLEDPARMVLGI